MRIEPGPGAGGVPPISHQKLDNMLRKLALGVIILVREIKEFEKSNPGDPLPNNLSDQLINLAAEATSINEQYISELTPEQAAATNNIGSFLTNFVVTGDNNDLGTANFEAEKLLSSLPD